MPVLWPAALRDRLSSWRRALMKLLKAGDSFIHGLPPADGRRSFVLMDWWVFSFSMNEQQLDRAAGSRKVRGHFTERQLAVARRKHPDPRTCTNPDCRKAGSIDALFGWRRAGRGKRHLVPEPRCFDCRNEASRRKKAIISPRDGSDQELFDEGGRQVGREIEIAIRNGDLVRLARNVHGVTCAACGFDFGDFYGPYGEGFIEIHHLLPIADG